LIVQILFYDLFNHVRSRGFIPSAFLNPCWRVTWIEETKPHFLERDGVLFFQKREPEKSNAKKIDLIVAKKWMKTPFDSRTGTGKKGFEW